MGLQENYQSNTTAQCTVSRESREELKREREKRETDDRPGEKR